MIKRFVDRHFHHFNARALRDAATGWADLLTRGNGGRMMLTLGGAMSTARLGISIAELIRRDCVHAICCTGANLEEDIFNLIAHDSYHSVPHYRDLTAADEQELLERKLNRVTDTCIPEEQAVLALDKLLLPAWQRAEIEGRSELPHQFLYELAAEGELQRLAEIDPDDSWVLAAQKEQLPIFCPGWEDSTLGNVFASHVMRGDLDRYDTVQTGPAVLEAVADWYRQASRSAPVGFFQVGGGISGDFPIAIVPLLRQDLKESVPLWSYFCQISEATTSYGSYSGAPPNEKITWEKLGVDTPRFVVESDATICFPLIAHYVIEQVDGG
jgi:deoxyhypusine synthase